MVQTLAAGKLAEAAASFDAAMAKSLPAEKLSSLWTDMLAQAGPFVKVAGAEVTPEPGGYQAVAMTCVFERFPAADTLVAFDRAGRVAGFYFGPRPTEEASGWSPPSYAAPESFREVLVTVSHGVWHLPGTLTLPKGAGPFPAVVLVPGSPPLDQDATMGPNKLFKDVAWGLASRGIAVLRYTKRTHMFGAGLGGGLLSSFSIREELDDDARAAVAALADRSEIDQRRTFLLGHSLGGVSAIRLASRNSGIAGIIVAGTCAENVLSVLIERAEYAAGTAGEAGRQASQAIPVLKRLASGEFPAGTVVDLFGERSPASYWADLRQFEPGEAAAKLSMPVIVLVAGHDGEVPSDDFEHWRSALAAKKNGALKLYPRLFHLFMPSAATGRGDTDEDWARPSHVLSDVVEEIASWIQPKNSS